MTIVVTHTPTAAAIGHTGYERYRRRQIAYGRWQRWTDPAPIRDHILTLRRHGMGRDRIARAAGVTEHTIRRIVNGHVNKVHIESAQKILAVTDQQPPYVDATGSRRRLQALGTLGWDQSTLARRIGWNVRNLNLIVSGKRTRVMPDTADRIHRLYEHLSATPAPAGYAAARARSAATRHGWAPPLAWEDTDLDDPATQPDLGDTGGGVDYDAVTVAQAVDGLFTYDQLATHRPNLIEAVRRLAATHYDSEITHLLRWPGLHERRARGTTRALLAVEKLRRDNGIPGRKQPAAIYPKHRRPTQAA